MSICFSNYKYSYNVEIFNSFNPELPLKNTEFEIKSNLKISFNELRDFKFAITFFLKFRKTKNEDERNYSAFYSKLKAETIILDASIDSTFESIYSMIMTKIQKYKGEGSV